MPALSKSYKHARDCVKQEYQALQYDVDDPNFPEIVEVTRPDDLTIRVKVRPENEHVLREMRESGLRTIEVEAVYPENYPDSPFFLRVVSPNIKPYTGFVSCQGAVLMECLSEGEGLRKWDSGISLDFVLMAWLQEACNATQYQIDSPGMGRQTAGPLAIVPGNGYGYSEEGARSDFARCVAANRWY